MEQKEIWRPVVGFEGTYEVSNLGKVKSVRKGNALTGSHCHGGYIHVILCRKGEKKITRNVHRIVAEAFIPNPNNLPQINHKDENKLNNRVENLEWCSGTYNMNYGTVKEKTGHKKPVEMLDENYNLIAVFKSGVEASEKTGVHKQSISNCCTGKSTYTRGGFHWRFHEENEQK